ncbi:ABC-type transport auxiliary lipoprotein family protein [Pseudoblastomonas halimionae]|nr:ABC-type transport auxiliary lipoprotein family protein [Alteriqipengyuania halimionae]
MRPTTLHRTARRTMAAGACAMLLGLAGCISFGDDPPPTLFSLTADNPAPAEAFEGTVENAILVNEPSTSAELAVLRVPVQIDASNVAYVKDAAWVERPSRQFRALLAETLRSRSDRLVFEDDAPTSTGSWTLSGRLNRMGYDAQAQAVIVQYDAISRNGDGPARARRFEARVDGVAPEAESIGPALNQAANDVAGQVTSWMIGG